MPGLRDDHVVVGHDKPPLGDLSEVGDHINQPQKVRRYFIQALALLQRKGNTARISDHHEVALIRFKTAKHRVPKRQQANRTWILESPKRMAHELRLKVRDRFFL